MTLRVPESLAGDRLLDIRAAVGNSRVKRFFWTFTPFRNYTNLDGLKTKDLRVTQTTLDAVALFMAAVPAKFFKQQRKAAGLKPEKGVYIAPVVVMMTILQRLEQGKGTLSMVVQQLLSGRLGKLVPGRHKRIKEDSLAVGTGAYSRARTRLPLAVAEGVCDQVAEHLLADQKEALPGLGRPAYFLDGTSFTLPHTEEILKLYPPASNQNGESHWPVARTVVAHDLVSGIGLRPAWGPMYGKEAVSEQALAELIIDRIPACSILVHDRNFGTFAVTWYADQKKHDTVGRLTDARARKLNKGKLPQHADQWMDWTPSRCDLKSNPHLPADARLRVRFISTQVMRKGKLIQLYLFTTLDLPVAQIVELYGLRWNIELDIRSLKQTLHLHALRAITPNMAAKELVLAVTAYNFVRGAIQVAAQAAGIDPRRISFSRAQDVINACLPNLQAADSKKKYEYLLVQMLRRIAQCKLPESSHRASHPRVVWPRRSAFPKNKPGWQAPQGLSCAVNP